MDFPPLEWIGTFTKTHGIKGGIMLRNETPLPQHLEGSKWIFVDLYGSIIPFPVEKTELFTEESAVIYLQMERIQQQVVELIGKKVAIAAGKKKKILPPDPTLKGYSVIDGKRGNIGQVKELYEMDMNPVLIVQKEKREILIPFHESIILRIDKRQKKIHIHAPDGLIDLYL